MVLPKSGVSGVSCFGGFFFWVWMLIISAAGC